MKQVNINGEMMIVINNWAEGGAEAACDRLDLIEDALLDEGEDVSAEQRLALIREVRILKKELKTFIPEDSSCS